MRRQQREYRDWRSSSLRRWKAKQHHAVPAPPSGVDELAEVLVFRKQHAPLLAPEKDDFAICCATGDLCNSDHVVAGSPQGADDGEVTALVGEEAHGLRVSPAVL
jgi:hypothetical protein